MNLKEIFKKAYLIFRQAILRILPGARKTQEPQAQQIKSILVVRIDRIGDLIVSLPALKALRDSFPLAKVAIIVRRGNDSLLAGIPWIDEIIIYRGFIKTANIIRQKQFDAAIDFLMDYSLKTALLLFFSKAKLTAGFDIEGRGNFFNLSFKPRNEKKHLSQHITDLVRFIVKASTGQELLSSPEYIELPLQKRDKEFARSFLKEQGIQENDIVIGIHPGGNYASQRWLVERFGELAEAIIKNYKAKIVVIGSVQEEGLIEVMARRMKESVVKAVGLPLNKLAGLIAQMDIFVCNNSGPFHIAVSLGVSTVSTMGPTDPALWQPTDKKHIVIGHSLSCSPCALGFCRQHACMKLISVQEMQQAVESQIERLDSKHANS